MGMVLSGRGVNGYGVKRSMGNRYGVKRSRVQWILHETVEVSTWVWCGKVEGSMSMV
jgi:hypothetical protein